MMNILSNLKEIRNNKNLTQAYIAKEVGVSIRAYSNWENGTSEPNEENMKKLKDVLKNG